LLERLDIVSAEHIYRSDLQTEVDPLQAAIVALRDTAREMREATGTMSSIDGGLQGLDRAFRSSFDTLSDRLTDLTAQHESALHSRTHAALEALRVQVSQLAQVTDANARVYAGLAESVAARSRESREAIELMTASGDQLRRAMESFVRVADSASQSAEHMERASAQVAEQSERATAQIGASSAAVATSVAQIQPALEQMSGAVERVARIASDSDKNVAQMLAGLGQRVTALAESMTVLEQAQARQRGAERAVAGQGEDRSANADVLTALRRIATSVERPAYRVPVIAMTVGPILGLLGGAALVYFMIRPH
jgi:ABC-type transporter Mla subunit MlaD